MYYKSKSRLGATKGPDGREIIKYTLLSKDGETPANVYHLKNGNRKEIESMIDIPWRFECHDKKKRLVFIVVAGHGTYKCAD